MQAFEQLRRQRYRAHGRLIGVHPDHFAGGARLDLALNPDRGREGQAGAADPGESRPSTANGSSKRSGRRYSTTERTMLKSVPAVLRIAV